MVGYYTLFQDEVETTEVFANDKCASSLYVQLLRNFNNNFNLYDISSIITLTHSILATWKKRGKEKEKPQ